LFLPLDKLMSGEGVGNVLRPDAMDRDDIGTSPISIDDARRSRDPLRSRTR
jgi:hypothetical protein